MKRILLSLMVMILAGFPLWSQVVVTQNFEAGATSTWTGYPATSASNTNAWTNIYTGTSYWQLGTTGSTSGSPATPTAHGGAGQARFYGWLVNATTQTLVSPVFDMSARGSNAATVSLWMYRSAISGATTNLKVYANTTNSLTGATQLTLNTPTADNVIYEDLGSTPIVTPATAGWYQYTFNIPASFNGPSNYLLFAGYGDYSYNFFIDDISYSTFPPVMVFNSATTITASQSPVAVGSTNQAVVAAKITTSGGANPFNLTSITFNTNGTNYTSDLVNAKLWSTGNSSTFAATTQVGSTVVSPNGSIVFSGLSSTILTGDNYYWLTYDIIAAPHVGTQIDAECTSITMTGSAGTVTPTVTAPAGNRTIMGPMSGTYQIGSGQMFANLGEAVNTMKALTLAGNCTFEITSDVVETAEVAMPIFTEVGAGGYYVTFKPVGGVRTVSGNFLGKLISLTGTDRVIFDGRLDINNPNETGRNLILRNMESSTGSNYTVYMNSSASSAGTGCLNVTFRNVLFKNNNNLTTSNYTLYATGYDNDNLTILNCRFETSGNGPYLSSSSSTAFWDNLILKDCEIGSTVPADQINYRAVYGYYWNNANVENNKITNINNGGPYAGYGYGLYMNYCTNSRVTKNTITGIQSNGGYVYGLYAYAFGNCVVDQNTISNLTSNGGYVYGLYWYSGNTYTGTSLLNIVEKNIISNCKSIVGLSSYAYYAYGLYISGSSTNTNINYFQNNLISDIAYMNYSTSYYAAGIYHSTAALTKLYHNTVNMFGTSPAAAYTNTYNTYGLYLTSGTTVDIQNNIFSNTMTHSVAGSKSYAIYVSAASYLGTCTNNNYYVAGAYGVLGYLSSDKPLMSDWKASLLTDNSRNLATSFTDNTLCYANGTMINANMVAPLLTTTTDFGGEVRTANNNFIGADAVTPVLGVNEEIHYIPVPARECFEAGSDYKMGFTGKITSFADGIVRTIPSVPMSYTWYKNDVALTTTTKYVPTADTLKMFNVDQNFAPDNFRATATYMGVTLNSAVKAMNVGPKPDFTTIIQKNFTPAFVCQYQNLTLNALVMKPEWRPFVKSYTWKYSKDGVTFTDLDKYRFPSYNQSVLTMNEVAPSETGYYTCEIRIETECSKATVTSDTVNMRVWQQFKIDYQPSTQTICENPSQKLLLSTIASGEISAYAWYRDGAKIDDTKYPSAKTPFLELGNVDYTLSGQYTCKITLSDCQGTNRVVETAPAEIYVLRATEITKQPVSKKIALGGRVQFEVEAYHKGKVPPSYKDKFTWFRYNATTKTSSALTNNDKIAGANSSLLTITGITAAEYTNSGDYYYCVVEGMCGNVTSGSATLTEPANIKINTQPVNSELCEGSDATFDVSATSSDPNLTLVYQWYKDGVKLVDGAEYMDVTTAMMTVKAAKASNAGKYSVRISFANDNNYIDSDNGELKVNLLPSITTQPVNPGTVTNGKDFTLTVVAKDAVSYQWTKNGNDITGETNASLTIKAAKTADAGTYAVKVLNTCGSVKSVDVAITVAKEEATGVNEDVTLNNVSVTPNPVNSNAIVNFNVTKQALVKLTLIDATGRTIATLFENNAQLGLNKVEFNVESLGLSSGVYYVNMDSEGSRYTAKMVITK